MTFLTGMETLTGGRKTLDDIVHDLPNRDGNANDDAQSVYEERFMTFLTGMETPRRVERRKSRSGS